MRLRYLLLTLPVSECPWQLDPLLTEAGWVFRQKPRLKILGTCEIGITVWTCSLPSEARLALDRATGKSFDVEVLAERAARPGSGEGPWLERPQNRWYSYRDVLQAERVSGRRPGPGFSRYKKTG